MDVKEIKATLVEKTSKNSGNKYQCVELQLTPTYKKVVFLEKAELELLALNNNKPSTTPFK